MKQYIFIVLIVMTSCQSSPTFTPADKEAVVTETKQMLNDYYKDIKVSGLTAEFKYLDHSADFFWTPPGYATAISYDSVATIIKHNATLFSSIENTFDDLRIVPLTKELASYTALISAGMTDTAGKLSGINLLKPASSLNEMMDGNY